MVAKPDARGQPGAVVVHFQHAAAAGRAVMGAVGLPCLALLAETHLAVGFYSEGGDIGMDVGRESAIAIIVGRAARRGEDGDGVRPVEKEVQEDSEEASARTCGRETRVSPGHSTIKLTSIVSRRS